MKNILVPIDFSRQAENALRIATNLAIKSKAELHLLYSFYSPHAGGHLSIETADQGKSVSKKLGEQELLKFFQKTNPTTKVEPQLHCSENELRKVMREVVDSVNIDFIVMGTQGTGWLGGKLFGTNTSWAIESMNCPVLAVPEQIKDDKIKHITYAAQFESNDLSNLIYLRKLSLQIEAPLAVLHITAPQALVEVSRPFKYELIEAQLIPELPLIEIEAGNIEEGIEHYLSEHAADLLVVAPHEHDALSKLAGNSISRNLVHRLRCTMLFLPKNNKIVKE